MPLQASEQCAPSREIRVGCVLDGDTFDAGACGEDSERFRLLGIDAPEIGANAECWGPEAGAELRRLLVDREVLLTFDRECEGVYGRTLAYAWLLPDDTGDEPVLVNEYMVHAGFAPVDPVWSEGIRMQERLEEAEASARARGAGLWGACFGGGT